MTDTTAARTGFAGGSSSGPGATLFERALARLSPERALRRLAARQSFEAMLGGYDGARTDKAALRNWYPRDLSADAAYLPDRRPLHARSRDLARNAPLAKGAIETNVTAIIGSGLKLRAQVNRRVLGLTGEQAREIEATLEEFYALWGDSVEADLQRRLTDAAQQQVTCRTVLEGGDCFTVLRMRRRAGSPFELKTQLIDGSRVSNPNMMTDGARVPNGNRVVGGIEIDNDAAPVAIYVTDYPAGLMPGSRRWDRVAIFGRASGLRQVLHHYVPLQPDQTRGVPYLAPVIELVKQGTRYSQSEVAAAVTASFFTVFVKSEGAAGLKAPTGPGGTTAPAPHLELGPAMIARLQPQESIEIADPNRPNADFDKFMLALAREIGAALEIPLPHLLRWFQGSYSVIRASILDFHRTTMKRRGWFVKSRQRPVYGAVIAEAVAKGWVALPGFFEDPLRRRAWLGAAWIGDPQGQLDPIGETRAAGERIGLGVSTRSYEATAINGGDSRQIHEVLREEHAQRVEAGLAPPVEGRSSTSYSFSQQREETAEERDAREQREAGDA